MDSSEDGRCSRTESLNEDLEGEARIDETNALEITMTGERHAAALGLAQRVADPELINCPGGLCTFDIWTGR
jgi:hypothetical protein